MSGQVCVVLALGGSVELGGAEACGCAIMTESCVTYRSRVLFNLLGSVRP